MSMNLGTIAAGLLAAVVAFSTGNSLAFEISGDSFDANFEITSVVIGEEGSTITSAGTAGDYGKVYLTHNLKSQTGSRDSGTFSGQARAIDAKGVLEAATVQGVWRREGKIITMYSLDDVSNGLIHLAEGTMDLVSGKLQFKVYIKASK